MIFENQIQEPKMFDRPQICYLPESSKFINNKRNTDIIKADNKY